jgi:uncharacterized protein (TIGR03435 family)
MQLKSIWLTTKLTPRITFATASPRIGVKAVTVEALLLLLIGTMPTSAISGQDRLRPMFEVASVKPVGPDSASALSMPAQMVDGMQDAFPIGNVRAIGTRVAIRNSSLLNLIAAAYRVRRTQITGPAWMSEQRFDVDAKIPDGAPLKQVNEMLQSLLEERFALRLHRETRNQSGFALIVGTNGPKIKVSVPGKSDELETWKNLKQPSNPVRGMARYRRIGITTSEFADLLSRLLHRPVVDMTGLQGKYDVDFKISPAPDEIDPEASVFDAVKSLGLKLTARAVSISMLAVDNISKVPTPN